MDDNIAALERKVTNKPGSAELLDFLKSVRTFQARNAAANASNIDKGEGRRATGLSMPFVTTDTAMNEGPKYNGYSHAFAGMAVQFILFTGIDADVGVLTAQRMGLWNRLLASPITIHTVLAAQATFSALIALELLLFIFAVAAMFFQAQVAGSMLGFLVVAQCFSLMTATFGLLIAAFGKTPEAARGMATFATLGMVTLGGGWAGRHDLAQPAAGRCLGTHAGATGLCCAVWRNGILEI